MLLCPPSILYDTSITVYLIHYYIYLLKKFQHLLTSPFAYQLSWSEITNFQDKHPSIPFCLHVLCVPAKPVCLMAQVSSDLTAYPTHFFVLLLFFFIMFLQTGLPSLKIPTATNPHHHPTRQQSSGSSSTVSIQSLVVRLKDI